MTVLAHRRPAARAAGSPARDRSADHADEDSRFWAAVRRLDHPLTSYYLLLGATTMLLVLGLVMVFSASSVESYAATMKVSADGEVTGSSLKQFLQQAIAAAIAVPVMWVASRLPPRAWRALAYLGLFGALTLLVLVVVMGTAVKGNRNWLQLGPGVQVQPAEFAKLALVVWGADLLARKQRLLNQWKHLLVPLLPVAGVVIGLVLLGNDLGTGLILIAIVAALLFFAGAPLRLFAALGSAVVVLVAVLSTTEAGEYRLRRFHAWLDPSLDPLNTGWQLTHSKFALASGGWWGVGLGASREKWGGLPEQQTDFIFAIVGEELGLVGTLALLGLFGALAYAGLRIALRTRDPFVRYAAAATTAWIVVQALVNMGAVTGLLPITGIPLPLVSYGGSALLTTMAALGMLLSFARREPGALEALRAGPGQVRRLLAAVRPGGG